MTANIQLENNKNYCRKMVTRSRSKNKIEKKRLCNMHKQRKYTVQKQSDR